MRLGILQEVDDFLEFGLGLVDAGHIGEIDAGALLQVDARLALADRQQPAFRSHAGLHAADDEQPDAHEQRSRHHPRQNGLQPARIVLGLVGDLVLGQEFRDVGPQLLGHELRLLAGFGLGQGAADVCFSDRHFADAAGIQQGAELAVGNVIDLLLLQPEIAHHGYDDNRHDQVQEVDEMISFQALGLELQGCAILRPFRPACL